MIPAEQAEAVALLRRLTGAEPIETHISAVFVGPGDAYKLKKALRLDFLDFSTLAAREHFARREFELNAPFAPGIYREVLPLTRGADGALRLGGAGEAVDWVLRMAPVPAGDFLDAVAERGGLDAALLDEVADLVAAMHAAAPVAEGVNARARMDYVLEGNRRGCLEAGLDPARVEAVATAMRARLDALAPVLAARAAGGHVRRCHGDLHLRNLCLWEGRPTPFDALEFDEALARTDTGYDLAFLLMDVDVRVGRAAANRVMNRVLARSGDAGLLPALPFWMAQRALVRAKIEAGLGRDGARYLAAAERYLLRVPPRLVAVGGLQGTGKTRLARALAPHLGVAPGAAHLRSDEIRKRLAGVAPESRLPPASYTQARSRAVQEALLGMARTALTGGHSVVLDAVFLEERHRIAAEDLARELGVPFAGFWLTAPLETLRSRVTARQGDASDATVEVLETCARATRGKVTWQWLDATADPTPEAARALALEGLVPA